MPGPNFEGHPLLAAEYERQAHAHGLGKRRAFLCSLCKGLCAAMALWHPAGALVQQALRMHSDAEHTEHRRMPQLEPAAQQAGEQRTGSAQTAGHCQ